MVSGIHESAPTPSLLDDSFTVLEMYKVAKELKINKNYNEMRRGLIKALPVN